MGGAEGVVDEDVAKPRELRRKGRVVRLFLGVKTEVFEQHHLARANHPNGGFGRRPDAVGAEWAGHLQQFADPLGDRFERVLRVRLAVRAPEVRQQHDAAAMPPQVVDRRQRGADARVVRDATVLHGYVEVDADESGLTAPVHVTDRAEAAHLYSLLLTVAAVDAADARSRKRGFLPHMAGSPTISLRMAPLADTLPPSCRATNAVMSARRQA